MTASGISPATLLAELTQRKSRPERLKNLAILNKVCEAQQAGSRDFRLPVIGRIFEAAGGIKARALNNKASDDYRALIEAWRASSLPMSASPKRLEGTDHAVFGRIDDLVVRSLMQSVWAERDRLLGELNLLKSTTTLLIDRRPASSDLPRGNPIHSHARLTLTLTERSALANAISSNRLHAEGWSEGENGEVRKGARTVFDIGYTRAIKKILKYTASIDGSNRA